MDEKLLLKICISFTIIGLFGIIIIPLISETKLQSISEISNQDLGKKTLISGEIKLKIQKEKLTLLDLKDETGKIEIVFFEAVAIKGNKAKISGIVNVYQGKLQLKGETIEFLD